MMILVSKDSKGKVRVASIAYDQVDGGYIITRETWQLGGKHTEQPSVTITKGKAKRTVLEQTQLEFNAHVKKYLDKGYKELPEDISIDDVTAVTAYVEELLGDGKTDSNGFPKQMNAKQADKVKKESIDKVKYWLASRKIDGVRLSLYWDGQEVKTASRGGGTYEWSTQHITKHPKLIEFFKNHPSVKLDGEMYKHGKSLQQISGAARREVNDSSNNWLEFYLFDTMDDTKTFEERFADLQEYAEELSLTFDPNREWDEGDLKIQIVPHVKVSGWANIMKLHNAYVSDGWEGLVIRDPSKKYKYGGRTNDMIKVKMYQDDEFEITGLSEGLRDEDMCFTMITADGKEFKAKPMGSRELKQQYREQLDALIGKMATVKFFYLSDEGTPLQPVLKAIRDYE